MTRHHITALVLLLGTAIAHESLRLAQVRAANLDAPAGVVLDIPTRIGEYQSVGEDFEVSKEVRELLQTSHILIRRYALAGGPPVVLTIVYAGTTRRSLHFPEVCFVGQGWEIREQTSARVGFSFWAKRLALTKGTQEEAVLYWFKTGDELTGNFFLNSWHWARNQMRFGAPTSAMIKLSTPITGQTEEQAFELLEDFALKFTPILMGRVN